MNPPQITHLGDRVFDLALDAEGLQDRAVLEAHVAACPGCAAEVAAARESFGVLAEGLPALLPAVGGRARLEAALTPAGRFAPLVSSLARFFDLGVARVNELLDEICDPAKWEQSPVPGLSLFHLAAGPAAAGADAGFVRIAAGGVVGDHLHLGEERVLVIQGECVDDDGTRYRRGDGWIKAAGSRHRFTVSPGVDLIHALVLWEGVQFDGIPKLGGNRGT